MTDEQHEDAISMYSAALSLDKPPRQDLFIKRSKAYIARGWLEDALNDANEVCLSGSHRLFLIDTSSLGHRTRPIVPMGLRGEAQSFKQRGRSRKCVKCV